MRPSGLSLSLSLSLSLGENRAVARARTFMQRYLNSSTRITVTTMIITTKSRALSSEPPSFCTVESDAFSWYTIHTALCRVVSA